MNMNLDGLTCIKKFDVPLQVTIMTWFIHQRKDLNSKLNCRGIVEYCSCYSDTRCVTTLPLKRNLDSRFEKEKGPTKNNEQSHVSTTIRTLDAENGGNPHFPMLLFLLNDCSIEP
jgi:hypothetical protein